MHAVCTDYSRVYFKAGINAQLGSTKSLDPKPCFEAELPMHRRVNVHYSTYVVSLDLLHRMLSRLGNSAGLNGLPERSPPSPLSLCNRIGRSSPPSRTCSRAFYRVYTLYPSVYKLVCVGTFRLLCVITASAM